jgi:translation elongation factor EF-Ts
MNKKILTLAAGEEHNPYGDFDNTVSDDSLIDNSEEEMIHQPFLMDSDRLVRDVLLESGMRIKSFVRYEVGQVSPQ